MIKVKKYVVVQILRTETDGKVEYHENWWPSIYDTFTDAKNSLAEEVQSINEFDEDDSELGRFKYEDDKMVYIEIWSAIYYKEHRNEEVEVDGESDAIKAHYCLIPSNCPNKVRKEIRKMNNCPVVKYKG